MPQHRVISAINDRLFLGMEVQGHVQMDLENWETHTDALLWCYRFGHNTRFDYQDCQVLARDILVLATVQKHGWGPDLLDHVQGKETAIYVGAPPSSCFQGVTSAFLRHSLRRLEKAHLVAATRRKRAGEKVEDAQKGWAVQVTEAGLSLSRLFELPDAAA